MWSVDGWLEVVNEMDLMLKPANVCKQYFYSFSTNSSSRGSHRGLLFIHGVLNGV